MRSTFLVTLSIMAVFACGGDEATGPGPETPHLVYVLNTQTDNVSVISAVTNEVVATVEVGERPQKVAITPDRALVYVATRNRDGSGYVSVISTATSAVVATVGVNGARDLAITSDGALVYAAGSEPSVGVISTATNTVVATVDVADDASAMAITPDGTLVYVAMVVPGSRNLNSDHMSVISTATNRVVTLGVGSDPHALAITRF